MKGSGRSQKSVTRVITWPTGYSVLPHEGGIMDQPYRLMEWFDAFMSGERKAANLSLNE